MHLRAPLAAAGALFLAVAIRAPAQSNESPVLRSTTDHFVIFASPSVTDGELTSVAGRVEAVFSRANAFLGSTTESPPIRLRLFATLEAKGLATGYTLPAHALSGTGEVFASVEPGFDGEVERAVAELLVARALGRPRMRLLGEGLAMYFTDGWRGRGYRYWAARIGLAGESVDLEDLLDNHRLAGQSYLIARPLAASFVDWAIDRFGKDNLLRNFSTWRPAPGELESLEEGWRAYLSRLHETEVVAGQSNGDGGAVMPTFQKGFCHAHEGYQIYNGYISGESDEALERLSSLGANAVSLTPFTYMGNPRTPSPLPFSHRSGAENDESVIHAALEAKRLGMSVMIKPHLWVRGSWPGEVEMQTETEWDEFFDYYWRWIRHYAVLAEMYRVEVLCVGVELSRSTAGQEGRWRELLGRIRRLFSGRITYAANWGQELEGIAFWDCLDFIGVNFYYPLSEERRPSDAALLEGVERALDRVDAVARRFDKRVIVTEVGFPSTPAPWLKPYERDRRLPPDEGAQARCYRAFCGGLSGRSSVAGVYWWKWPSYLDHGGSHHNGYTPNGKQAEAVVRRWFSSIPAE